MGFRRDPVGNPGPEGGVRLEECLLEAAERGAAVQLVLNHVTPMFSPANTSYPVEGFFRRRDPAGRVRLRRLYTPQTVPIHGKVFVIDDRVAFLMGSGFAQEYFDGRDHVIDDPRRGHLRWRSSVRVPVHDVSVRIEGPAVADLDATVRLLWDHARPSGKRPSTDQPPLLRQSVTGDSPGRTTLQVTRTLSGDRRYAGSPAGETGIYESYLRALESAERFIYLENQYLTCPELVDALIRAMRRVPALQLILLINIRPDVPYYVTWQRRALQRLLSGLGEHRDRAGVFTLWSHEKGPRRTRILRTHVHSKVGIIDDAWLTIGSANLDSLSLSHSQHELHRPPLVRLGRLLGGASGGDPWQARAMEVNVTCVDDEAIERLRRDLWAEHLGLDSADDPVLVRPPDEGWLTLWQRCASLKLDGLRSSDPAVTAPRILPYPRHEDRLPQRTHHAADHLRALGVDPDLIDVRERFRSFSFRHGHRILATRNGLRCSGWSRSPGAALRPRWPAPAAPRRRRSGRPLAQAGPPTRPRPAKSRTSPPTPLRTPAGRWRSSAGPSPA
jgi:phosphatidylserine/phosphatidylglycerophosphate/cardiolipin synthase-like enzyme